MTDNGPTHDPADTPLFNEDQKNQTLRISLDSVRPAKSPLEAKKSTGVVPGIPAHVGPIPQTIRLKRPPTSPITVQPIKKAGDTAFVQAPTVVRAATAETVKRQTSRIGMAETAAPKSPADFKRSTGPIVGIPTHAGPIPQTIRLKRPATSPIKRPPTSQIIARPAEPAGAPRSDQDLTSAPTVIKHLSKSATSRIVLEEMAAQAATKLKAATSKIPPLVSTEPAAPKTIRLKRPSTLSDAGDTITLAEEEAGALQASKKGETAKIDLALDESAMMPMTQRKTIKIKRTLGAIPPRSTELETAAAPEPASLAQASAPEEEEALVFPIVACAATLCIAALVYIMVAQAFGVHLLLPASMPLH